MRNLSIKSDMLTFDNVEEKFVPISKRIIEQTNAIPLENMPDISRSQKREYDNNPLNFSVTYYEFSCIYEGKNNPDIVVSLTYYVPKDGLSNVVNDAHTLNIHDVVTNLEKAAYDHICNVISEGNAINIFINKRYDETSNFVVAYDDEPIEEALEEPYKYMNFRNGKVEVLEF